MDADHAARWTEALSRGMPREGILLVVDVAAQTIALIEAGLATRHYRVSTSRNGTGSIANSHRTPTGWHEVAEWIGDGLPAGAVFRARRHDGEVLPEFAWMSDALRDTILTRIMWLSGLEDGVNRGPGIDTHDRYIYLHGTNHEQDIGRPASAGCVRLGNRDMLDVFDRTKDKPTWCWIG